MCLWGGSQGRERLPASVRLSPPETGTWPQKTTEWQQRCHLEINVLGYGHHVSRATVEVPERIIVVSSECMDLPPLSRQLLWLGSHVRKAAPAKHVRVNFRSNTARRSGLSGRGFRQGGRRWDLSVFSTAAARASYGWNQALLNCRSKLLHSSWYRS